MKLSRIVLLIMAIAVLITGQAWATYMADITYTYTASGNNYTFDFTVMNTSTGADTGELDYFNIDFDAGDVSSYSNIVWVDDNGWLSGSSDPFPVLGLPGWVNADDSVLGAGGGGIAQGDSLGGFKVNFDYDGSIDTAADMFFSFHTEYGTEIDGEDYYIAGDYDGTTRYIPPVDPCGGGKCPPRPVPEPSTLMLIGAGIAGLVAVRRRIK